ncbi:response regulator [Microbaculum sp. FT89]|uniref:response regulator n=1 Tax=Microbaculum sp. FT89 TaxID=3447298 RepID=UPI003F53ADEF
MDATTPRSIESRAIILCVEDEAELLSDLAEELTEAGYLVIAAESGEQALSRLETTRPDLILCDIGLPGLDGYAVLETVRARHPDLAEAPFLFLTALASPREIIQGKQAGADDYLVKPIDYDLMLATIEARLRQVNRIRARNDEIFEALRASVPHLASTGADAPTTGIRQVLDRLALGIVLADSQCRVLFANRAAHDMAARKDGLNIDARIWADHAPTNAALNRLVREKCTPARNNAEDLASLSVPRHSGQRDLMVLASALSDPAGAKSRETAAVLFLSDPEQRPSLSRNTLCALFALTPTEAKIAAALAAGSRPADIAADLGIAPTTVAFHLRNLFQKTGTSRQADLVALLLVSPAAGAIE